MSPPASVISASPTSCTASAEAPHRRHFHRHSRSTKPQQDNPRLPAAMTEKTATVTICADGSCSRQVDAASGNLVLKPNMTDVEWKATLKPVEKFPVVHLKDVWNSWGGFVDKALGEAFTADIQSACAALHSQALRWMLPLRRGCGSI